MELDLDGILKIMDRFDQSEMTKFVYENENVKLKLETEKTPVISSVVPSQELVQIATTEAVGQQVKGEEKTGHMITSPLVGTFYAAKAEGEAPFVSVGDSVKKGQTIGIIEAMKLMNEIQAEQDGVVTEILVENEQLVEYGQPLVRIV